jgi:hypothetical protein
MKENQENVNQWQQFQGLFLASILKYLSYV